MQGQGLAPLCDDNLAAVPLEYTGTRVQSHRVAEI